MTDVEIAWVAGVVEGEGSFLTSMTGEYGPYACVQVGMTDGDVIERLASVTGMGRISVEEPSRGRATKTLYRWRVQKNADACALAVQLLPHLGQRRRSKAVAMITTCAR